MLIAPLVLFAAASRPAIHSHNDYWRERPMLEALEAGAGSLEADVFLIDGELRIGHSLAEAQKGARLQDAYVPFVDHPILHQPVPEGRSENVILLVDIKEDGTRAWARLRELLAGVKGRLAGARPGPVRVVVSGDRDQQAILSDPEGLAGVDGRFDEPREGIPAWRIPLVSGSWTSFFAWSGQGAFPEDQASRLTAITSSIRAEGRRSRFWASPDLPLAWSALLKGGADFINTDRPGSVRAWLDAQPPAHSSRGA
jgi:hypothetical protein